MKIWRCATGLVVPLLLGWCFGCSDLFFPVMFSPRLFFGVVFK